MVSSLFTTYPLGSQIFIRPSHEWIQHHISPGSKTVPSCLLFHQRRWVPRVKEREGGGADDKRMSDNIRAWAERCGQRRGRGWRVSLAGWLAEIAPRLASLADFRKIENTLARQTFFLIPPQRYGEGGRHGNRIGSLILSCVSPSILSRKKKKNR